MDTKPTRTNKRYRVGSLYYECGVVPDLNGRFVPWIETWVYMGYVRRNCSSVSCDEPGHFYYFKRYDPVMAHMPPEKWETTGIYIPSLRHAMRTKLTWRQLMAYGLPKMLRDAAATDEGLEVQ